MTSFRLEFKWAVIYTATLLVWITFERILGWHDAYIDKHHIYTLFFYIPAILLYYLALTDKRNNFYGGIITYRQAFISGLILAVFISLLAVPAQYVIHTVISPSYFENITAFAIENGKATPAEALDFFNLRSYIIQAVVASIFTGVIFSAILALFVKRK